MKIATFPRTPHFVWFGEDLHDDKLLTRPEQKSMLAQPMIVQEKVDGNCLGFTFDEQARPVVTHREGIIDKYNIVFAKVQQWYKEHEDALFDMCGSKYTVFGEWLYLHHTIKYTRLPSYYLVHDIVENGSGKFLATTAVHKMAQKHGFCPNPIIYEGHTTLDELLELHDAPSQFGDSKREGIYLRTDDKQYNVRRAKIVTADFHKLLAKSGHWRDRDIHTRNVSLNHTEAHMTPYVKKYA